MVLGATAMPPHASGTLPAECRGGVTCLLHDRSRAVG